MTCNYKYQQHTAQKKQQNKSFVRKLKKKIL